MHRIFFHLMIVCLWLVSANPAWSASLDGTAGNSKELPAASQMDPYQDDNLDFLDEEMDDKPSPRVADPLESWNRAMFEFNDRLYFWVMKPVSLGYRNIVPEIVRIGVQNFFSNLAGPIRIVNCFLQGKMESSANEMARFVYNTTFGVLGFGNPAKDNPALNPSPEDMGQTLAVFGLGDGFFIIWPFLGPSTLRDTAGMCVDGFMDPIWYIDDTAASVGIKGVDMINSTSFRIGDYEAFKDSAIEPYQSFKNVYMQFREKRISDQN
ncbi:MAG: VacJ family lipoprotein [Desulfatirhabdiaceae bacterium]